ncbi:hypothetical protein ANANG_G00029360 [Anguilla anguilla]|uniref:Uncharacterized protein n=1 Tax=Anguilla anguilla TaxID=7936 RepID=A0A9D3MVN4_ANGAN|nr:hypothetical protein ANANG_G00029360 [Anguilla anguilla]
MLTLPPARPGHGGARAMCTTIMVLSTLAIVLRRRFANRVRPLDVDTTHCGDSGFHIMAHESTAASVFALLHMS